MERSIERVNYDDDVVRVYCLNHPAEPMTHDPRTGWWKCDADQCAAAVSVHGPKRDASAVA